MPLKDYVLGQRNKIVAAGGGTALILAAAAGLYSLRVEDPAGNNGWSFSAYGVPCVGEPADCGSANQVLVNQGGSGVALAWENQSGGAGAGGSAGTGNVLSLAAYDSAQLLSGSYITINAALTSITIPDDITVRGTMSGYSLTVSNLLNCDTIDTDASGVLSCGTDDGAGGGFSYAELLSYFISDNGGTSTGKLTIDVTGGNTNTIGFETPNTISGAIIHAQDLLTSSGTIIAENGFIGALTGNASTATALAANGANCSAGNAPLGVDASGAVESCFDVWTEAENTAAAYLQNVVEDTTPTLGGELDANSNNIIGLSDITFRTGAQGGTLRTGTSAADKFVLQGYDVDDGVYRNVFEVDAGNTVLFGFNQDANDIDFRAEGTTDANLLYLDASTDRVGIGTATPAAKLGVVGATILSGNLSVQGTMSGHHLYAGTMSGAGLTDCDNAVSSKLLWDATTQRFSCGSDQDTGGGGGLSFAQASTYFLQDIGGTSTGAINVIVASGTPNTIGFETPNTISGAIVHAQDLLRSSGSLIVEGTSTLNGAVAISAGALSDGSILVGDLSSTDFGSFTCNGTTCTIDNGAVTVAKLASADFGSWTCNGSTCTLDTSTVGASQITDNSVALADVTHTDTLAGNPALAAGQCYWASTGIICEGSTADSFEALFTVTNPTADRIFTLQDATGTIPLHSAAVTDLAGRSMTVNSTTLDADAELYTKIASFVIEDPTASDTAILQHKFPTAITITRISCSTDTGTATIQFDERTEGTPNTGGTDVMTSALACDTNTEATTSFTNAGIAADAVFNLDIDSVASTPGVVRIHVDFQVDD